MVNKHSFGIAVFLVMVLFVSGLTHAQSSNEIRVQLVAPAAESGFVDAHLKLLQDSYKDLQKALKKQKDLVAVDDHADVTLTVTDRGWIPDGDVKTDTFNVFGSAQSYSRKDLTPQLVVTLTVGKYSTKLISKGVDKCFSWSCRAEDIISQADHWISENRSKLLALRQQN